MEDILDYNWRKENTLKIIMDGISPSQMNDASTPPNVLPPFSYNNIPLLGYNTIPTIGPTVTGDNADFWALLAICAMEDSDPQGRADVAQSIYNRKGSKAYGNKSIKELITSPAQYQPTFDKKSPNGKIIAQVWKNINSLQTAIEAIKYTKGYNSTKAETYLKDTYNALKNPTYRQRSMDFVQGRTDFLGVGQQAINMTQNGSKVQRTSRNNQFGFSNNYRKNVTYTPPPISWFINFDKEF